MKAARFRTPAGPIAIGFLADGQVHELEGASSVLEGLISRNPAAGKGWRLDEVQLLAPIPEPQKVIGIGLNYMDHVQEGGTQREKPAWPIFFNKQVTSVSGPHDPIVKPSSSDMLDFEGELAVVIGMRCRDALEANALSVVAGYMVANDVSVRDWQRRSPTITMGKSFDTHCPTGPWVVGADEIPDPHGLSVETWLNGECVQTFDTSGMLFRIERQIAELSAAFTLMPGDLLLTGTGKGVGARRTPPLWMKPGDRIEVSITSIGRISNLVVEQPR